MYSTHVGLEHAIGNRRGRCVQWVGNMYRYPLRKLLGVRKKDVGTFRYVEKNHAYRPDVVLNYQLSSSAYVTM